MYRFNVWGVDMIAEGDGYQKLRLYWAVTGTPVSDSVYLALGQNKIQDIMNKLVRHSMKENVP